MNPKPKLALLVLGCAVLGVAGLWMLHDALSDGVIHVGSRTYTRDGTPYRFWRLVVGGGFSTALFGAFLVALLVARWRKPAEDRKIDAWIRRNEDFDRPDKRSER